MLGIVGDVADIAVARREIDAPVARGMRDRATFAQLLPDRVWIGDPCRIKMVPIRSPIRHRSSSAMFPFPTFFTYMDILADI